MCKLRQGINRWIYQQVQIQIQKQHTSIHKCATHTTLAFSIYYVYVLKCVGGGDEQAMHRTSFFLLAGFFIITCTKVLHLLLTWPVRAVDEAVIGVVTVAVRWRSGMATRHAAVFTPGPTPTGPATASW